MNRVVDKFSYGRAPSARECARVVIIRRRGYWHARARAARGNRDIVIIAEPDGPFWGAIAQAAVLPDDFSMVWERERPAAVWAQATWAVFRLTGSSPDDSGAVRRPRSRLRLHAPIDARRPRAILDDLTVGGRPSFLNVSCPRGARQSSSALPGTVGDSKITGSLTGTLRTGFNMIALIVKYKFK